jgi:CHAD domain-containing protein
VRGCADALYVSVTDPASGVAAPPVGRAIASGLSAGAVVRRCLGTDVARLLSSDPVARQGDDIEGVHQARVAARRLRSHLSTFADVLRQAPTVRLSKDLRWLGRALGSVRDLDVLRERLAHAVKAIDPLARDDGLALLGRADEEREVATAALQVVFNSERYRSLLERLASSVAAPPFRRSAGLPADTFLLEAVSTRHGALAAAIEALPPAPLDTELHAVRILAKPTRYAAEAGAQVLGQRCAKFAKRVTELCDDLGDLNDGSRVSLWLDAEGTEPSRAPTVARVRAVEIGRMADARAAWVRSWERVEGAAAELGLGDPATTPAP